MVWRCAQNLAMQWTLQTASDKALIYSGVDTIAFGDSRKEEDTRSTPSAQKPPRHPLPVKAGLCLEHHSQTHPAQG